MPDEGKSYNPILSVTGGKKKSSQPPAPTQKPMSQDEIVASFAPDPHVIEEDVQKQEERRTLEPIIQRDEQRNTLVLPPRPPVKKRRNKKLRFTDIYTPITFYIDKRIAPSLKEYLEEGESNTALANQIFLKILLEAGYDIDPNILTKPPTKRT